MWSESSLGDVWVPMEQSDKMTISNRINDKIVVLTYNTLHTSQPPYFAGCLTSLNVTSDKFHVQ